MDRPFSMAVPCEVGCLAEFSKECFYEHGKPTILSKSDSSVINWESFTLWTFSIFHV